MEEPNDDNLCTIDTCVSLEHLVDEPYARKRKISLRCRGASYHGCL